MGNVQRLILAHNNITITGDDEHRRLFSNFYSLKYLHLTNAFTEAEDSAKYFLSLERIFTGSSLDELKILHLEQNEIHSFSNGGVFCHLPAVEEIYLGDNLIRSLSFNVSCLTKLRVLDLRRNLIEFLDEGSRKLLDEIPSKNFQVDLGMNPFLCDCHIKDTLTWMNETKVLLLERKDYSCRDGIPKSNINKTLDEIRELQCFSASSQSVNAGTSILSVLFVLICLFFVVALIFTYRNSIRRTLLPYVEHLSRKIQYTTLREPEPDHL